MTRHWAADYIGLGWDPDGEGPETYNCWSFVRAVLADRFGVEVPVIEYPESDADLDALFDGHPERSRWRVVAKPRQGDLVLMRFARDPSHVGVWIDAGGAKVLHCARGAGVVCQRVRDITLMGGAIDGFYRFAGEGSS